MTCRRVKLGTVVKLNPKFNPSDLPVSGLVAFLAMADVGENGKILNIQRRAVSEVIKGYTPFWNGDVLLAKITPCFENGKAALVDGLFSEVGFGSTEFHVIRPSDEIDTHYLFHLMWNARLRSLGKNRMTGSAGQKRLPAGFLKDLDVSLPTLGDQKRIAAILEKADNLSHKRERTIRLSDDFLRAIFLEMFGDPMTNPKGWGLKRLGDVSVIATGGTPSRDNKSYFDGNVPWVKTGEVDNDWIVETDEHISEHALRETNCKLFPERTILLAMYGQGKTRGKVGMLGIPASTNQACAAILPSTEVAPEFILDQLKIRYREIRQMGRGGNQENLNLSMVKRLPVILPPRDAVCRYLAVRDRIRNGRRLQQQSMASIEALRNSFQSFFD